MIKFIFLIFVSISFSVLAQSDTKINTEGSDSILVETDVISIIKDYTNYNILESNIELSDKFYKYMVWMSDKAPDAKLVLGFMDKDTTTLDEISTIFHEKVEFAEWLNIGHDFDDILNIEYYKKHYMEVYAIAHRIAVIEEMNLIKYVKKFFLKTN